MLIDPDKNIVSIFSNSKASDPYYGMDGFIYRIDMYSQKWTKEVVFTKANYGWFSFFGGSDNGNPELYHFSFAGYYAMLSKRNVSGNWSSQRMGSIRPEMADNQYFSHKNILITGYRNVDRMDLQNKNYTSSSSGSSNNYSSGSSKSSSRSSSISTGEIIVGAAVIGVAIFGLSKLFGGSDDNKSSSSSSSSLSSSSKTSSSPSHSNANASRFDEPGYVISINGATSLPDETETNEGKCLCCQKTVDRVISKWIDSKGKKFWRYTCPKCKRIINNYEGK
jgi:hypothetical protein